MLSGFDHNVFSHLNLFHNYTSKLNLTVQLTTHSLHFMDGGKSISK